MSAPITSVNDWYGFDTVIDVRSPGEFAYDHVPCAQNMWVLDDQQRAQVGTVYKRQGPFEGRKLGGGLVAQNTGLHIQANVLDKPKDWRPMVYCWRGGMRSNSFATVLASIGFRVSVLKGGYKAYRSQVLGALPDLCEQPRFVVLGGKTGVGKTQLLTQLAQMGQQVLDLEGLANHRGSLFGALGLPDQPSSAKFDSLLFQALSAFDASRPVYVESESSKVGQCHLPKPLLENMRQSPKIDVSSALEDRVERIALDYASAFEQPDQIKELLSKLPQRLGHEMVRAMLSMVDQGEWKMLIETLILHHYDHSYGKSHGQFVGPRLGGVESTVADPHSAAAKVVQLVQAAAA